MNPMKKSLVSRTVPLVLALVMVGCSGWSGPDDLEPLDPADILGAAQYAVAVDLDGDSTSGPASDQREWSGIVSRVEWSADEAWTAGQRLQVKPPEPGARFVFAVSDQVELESVGSAIVVARDIEYEGRELHLALVVLDDEWVPIAGTQPALAAGIEAAVDAATQDDRSAKVRALLDESLGFNNVRNIDQASATEPELVAAARVGAGLGNAVDNAASLDQWLQMPADARQLAAELVDVPSGADRRLGVEWAWRELAVAPSVSFASEYQWVGAYFPGIGILGPVALNAAGEPTVIVGFGPAASAVEVIAWKGRTAIPGEHDVLTSAPSWTSESMAPEPQAVWVDAISASDVKAEILTRPDYEARLMEYARSSSQSDGSESENPDPEDLIDR